MMKKEKHESTQLSETYFLMFGGHCRQVNLVSPTHADEYPYELAKMKVCTNSAHKHVMQESEK